MTAATALLVLAVGCAACATVAAVLMAAWLDRNGVKTPLPLLRWFVLRNLAHYRSATRAQTGKTGVLYYTFVVAMSLAWVLALAAALVWWSTR